MKFLRLLVLSAALIGTAAACDASSITAADDCPTMGSGAGGRTCE